MARGSISIELESTVEAKRLWNAVVKDGNNFLPSQVPEFFESFTILEGNGGVGTVRQVNFTAANPTFSYVKEIVEEVDEANFVFVFRLVEGGELGKTLASAKFTLKFTPKAGGGCVYTWTFDYETLPGAPAGEDRIEESKAIMTGVFRKMEAHLLANPSTYC